MSRRRYSRALPQNVHIMPKGHSTRRLCGETTGGFIRERDREWLAKFLRDGGKLCPNCDRIWNDPNRRPA